MVAALLLTALAQLGPCGPEGPIFCSGGAPKAFFEFAPADGTGMGAACACTTPTGAKGEAMTFSRASSATCLKTVGATLTNVQPGDMVTCTSGQPRVMPGPDGTSVKGLLRENASTNIILQSQAFDNAAWTPENSGCAAPTITANAAVAPDGTTTAERFQIPACTGAQYSAVFQNGFSAVNHSAAVWLKGNGQSGTFHIETNGGCAVCSYTAAGWSRCKVQNVLSTVMAVGIDNADCGGGSTGPQDVFVSQAQIEAGDHITSDIVTTTAPAARAGEVPDVALAFGAGTTGYCMAGTTVLEGLPSNPVVLGCLSNVAAGGAGAGNYSCPDFLSGVFRGDAVPVSTAVYTSSLAVTTASRRFVDFFDPSTVRNVCVDGTCDVGVSGKTWTPPTWLAWRLGTYAGDTNGSDGVIKLLQLDPSPTGCKR